jgi:hypothetical protein
MKGSVYLRLNPATLRLLSVIYNEAHTENF